MSRWDSGCGGRCAHSSWCCTALQDTDTHTDVSRSSAMLGCLGKATAFGSDCCSKLLQLRQCMKCCNLMLIAGLSCRIVGKAPERQNSAAGICPMPGNLQISDVLSQQPSGLCKDLTAKQTIAAKLELRAESDGYTFCTHHVQHAARAWLQLLFAVRSLRAKCIYAAERDSPRQCTCRQ